jgi:hypothetical protein
MRVFLAKFLMFLTELEELIYLQVVYFTMQTVYGTIQHRTVDYWYII